MEISRLIPRFVGGSGGRNRSCTAAEVLWFVWFVSSGRRDHAPPSLPRLQSEFALQAVLSRTGANARAIADQFGAAYATTAFEHVLADSDVDLVMIATRHDLHGSMVFKALQAGKDVFVEKPLTLDPADLDQLGIFYQTEKNPPLLMTGYNRRFSPAMQRIRALLQDRANDRELPHECWVFAAGSLGTFARRWRTESGRSLSHLRVVQLPDGQQGERYSGGSDLSLGQTILQERQLRRQSRMKMAPFAP